VLRLVGLQERLAGVVRPARPARDLAHEREGPFRRPQVGPVEPDVRVDHPGERELREVVPLGHELRADDDVRRPVGDLLDGSLSDFALP
jgi:hypothetical protein